DAVVSGEVPCPCFVDVEAGGDLDALSRPIGAHMVARDGPAADDAGTQRPEVPFSAHRSDLAGRLSVPGRGGRFVPEAELPRRGPEGLRAQQRADARDG